MILDSKVGTPEKVSDEALLQSVFSVLQDEMEAADTSLRYYGGGQNYNPYPLFGYFPQYYNRYNNYYYNKWRY